jgi:proline dehydrogenase
MNKVAASTRPLVQRLLFPLATRFVAGDSVSDAVSAVMRLNADGLRATVDVLGEDVGHGRGADAARDAYFALIESCSHAQLTTNLSLKLSALGLAIGDGGTMNRYLSILERAAVLPDPFVRVDMEGSKLLPRTLGTVIAAFARHRNTGPVLQAYLHRTQADVETMIELGMRVRLCKGAYRESKRIAFHKAPAIRKNFIACASRLLKDGAFPAFATHDAQLIEEVRSMAAGLGVPKTAFEFQMLYGVRPDLQRSLAQAGYGVRVYVPFGSHWAKYFRRRILERRENLVFALRSAFASR